MIESETNVSRDVVVPLKKSNIKGRVFHIFYPDLNTAVLFDQDFTCPIIWGYKMVMLTTLKNIDKLLNVPNTTIVWVYSYILDNQGYRRIDIYHGPINTIGKYIRRY